MKACIVKLSHIVSNRLILSPHHYLYDNGLEADLERCRKALASMQKTVETKEKNLEAYQQHIQSLIDSGVVIPL